MLPRKIDLPILVAVGVFQMGLTLIFSTYGLSLIKAGKATFLIYTTPIWIILITAILNKRLTALDAFGFLFGLAGTLSLIDPLKLDWSNPLSWTGELSLVLAALSWSIGILATRRLKWHNSPQKLLLWQVLIATLLAILYARWSGVAFLPAKFNFILIGSLLYTGVLGIALGYWFMIILSKSILPAITSFGLLWVPIISLTISCLFLQEQLTLHLSTSVLLILFGILLHIYSEIKTHRRNRDLPS